MKSIKQYFLVVAALAVVLAVVSCKSEDDDSSKSVSYTTSTPVEGFNDIEVTFYDNNTFVITGSKSGETARLEGTYDGDVNEDETIVNLTLNLTKASVGDQELPEGMLPTLSLIIGGTGLDTTGKGTISDGGETLKLGAVTYTLK